MVSSKSPRKVMELAWRLGNRHLPQYASRFSRHDFTQPQLFACLVLMQFYKLDYRGVEGLLGDTPGLCEAIEMTKRPAKSTLNDAFGRLVKLKTFAPMLSELAEAFEEAGLLKLSEKPVAVDSSMFESRHVSSHFQRRKEQTGHARGTAAYKAQISKTVKGLPKLSIAVAAACHLILAAVASTGSSSDHVQADRVVTEAWARCPVACFVADAGYDGEKRHQFVREDLSCDLLVPAVIGCSDARPPKTFYRRESFERFKTDTAQATYHQRWQAETAISMLKRNFGSALTCRTPARRENELLLKAMTHNLAI